MKILNISGTAIKMDDCTIEEAAKFASANDMLLVRFPNGPFLGFRKEGNQQLWDAAARNDVVVNS